MNVQPRELASHYKAIRARLRGVPVKEPVVVAPKPAKAVPVIMPIRITCTFGHFQLISTRLFLTVQKIIHATAEHFEISTAELVSIRRQKHLVAARQVAMYLAKKLTKRSYPDIARRMGNRDHTTVLHGCEKIERLLTDPKEPLHRDIAAIRAMLGA